MSSHVLIHSSSAENREGKVLVLVLIQYHQSIRYLFEHRNTRYRTTARIRIKYLGTFGSICRWGPEVGWYEI